MTLKLRLLRGGGRVIVILLISQIQFVSAESSSYEKPPVSFKTEQINKVLKGDFSCDYRQKQKYLACLIFQSAIGSMLIEGFEISESLLFEESDEINLRSAIEALNQIPSRIIFSRFELKYNLEKKVFQFPNQDPGICLAEGYGLCGNHTAVFLELMNLLEIDSRQVQFYYFDDDLYQSHIAVEILTKNKWRFMDPSYGVFYHRGEDFLNVVGIDDLVNDGFRKFTEKRNASNLSALAYAKTKTLDSYLGRDVSFVYGQDTGTVVINNRRYSSDGSIYIEHIPNYIGDNVDDGAFTGIDFVFEKIPHETILSVNIYATAGCDPNESQICLNQNCSSLEKGLYTFETDSDAKARLYLRSQTNICYALFDQVYFTPR